MPPMMAPPGAPSLPGQVNGLPRPPTLAPPTTVPGAAMTPTSSNGAPTMAMPAPYQTNPAVPTSGGFTISMPMHSLLELIINLVKLLCFAPYLK